jgi:hypothetical protein
MQCITRCVPTLRTHPPRRECRCRCLRSDGGSCFACSQRPELRTYCILTVLNNWWMDALGVWELLEWIIFQCTGCVSFRMAVADPKQYQVASNFSLKDVAGHGQGVPSTSLFSTAKHWIPKLLSSR